MIRINSRYATAPVQYILDARTGATRPAVMREPRGVPYPQVTQKWQDGMRLDLLGTKYARTSINWWQIMDRNSDTIDPLSFSPGERIVLQ